MERISPQKLLNTTLTADAKKAETIFNNKRKAVQTLSARLSNVSRAVFLSELSFDPAHTVKNLNKQIILISMNICAGSGTQYHLFESCR